MTYARPPGAKQFDFQEAREIEEVVGSHLPQWKIGNLSSPDKLDWWVPGYMVEVKAKRQPLSRRWTRFRTDVPEKDLFVLDELSVRRACGHWPAAFFVIHDRPQNRWFMSPVWELVCIPKVRVMRGGKGKWLMSLGDYRPLSDLQQLSELIPSLMVKTPWKDSGCLGPNEPEQVPA